MGKGVILCYRKIKNGFEGKTGKEKDMFTMTSKLYFDSEREHEALHVYKQSYDVVRLNRIKHYWDLCGKRRE